MAFSNVLKNAQTNMVSQSPSVMSLSLADAEIPTEMSLDISEEYVRNIIKYKWFDDFYDNKYSTIDENKNITVDASQVNISQEQNSQFIPFKLPRYWDGIDLTQMTFWVHYETKEGCGNSSPINFQYSDSNILFGWLVDLNVTYLPGIVNFEIIAEGTITNGTDTLDYTWKTNPNGKLNIIESLKCSNKPIEPTVEWETQILNQMSSMLSKAEQAVVDAQAAAQDAQDAVTNVNETIINTAVERSIERGDLKYATKSEVTDVSSNLQTMVANKLLDYYTKTEVDDLLSNIDISSQLEDVTTRVTNLETAVDDFDGLANLNIEYEETTNTLSFFNGENLIKSIALNTNPSSEWVTAYDTKVDNKISTALSPVQSELSSYKEQIDTDLQGIHSTIDGLPETLQTDYYTKTQADTLLQDKANQSSLNELSTTVSSIKSTSDTNKDNIALLGTKVAELESSIGTTDIEQLTYDVDYNEESVFTFYEIENEGKNNEVKTAKKQFVIKGGSGGSATSSVLKIEYVTKTPFVVTTNDSAIIKYNFSGTDSSGDDVLEGNYTWKIGNTIIATGTAVSGENSFDATKFIALGTQKLVLSITDEAGSLVTKTWTVQKVDIRIESSFNDKVTYPVGEVSFDYTPYGAIAKDIHFKVDGEELYTVNTTSSGIPMAYVIQPKSHGSHLVEVYITADINGNTVESNHIYKDILLINSSSDIPVIGCTQQNITAKQYDTTNITYTVFDPKTESPTVILAVDGETISTLSLNEATQVWQYKTSEVGKHTLTITCRDTVKTIYLTVEKLDINIEPITANLAFDFNPVGRSNNNVDRLWSDGDIAMTVSDNFDWSNGGYQIDENGDQYFCIKAGTSAEINYKLFADDAKKNGKEFKLVFKTTNVARPDAKFLSCIDNTTEDNHIGIEMFAHEANIYAQSGKLELAYSEEDIIEFEFNINKNTEDIPMVVGYEDGVSTRPMVYDDSHSFTQTNPKVISLGSTDCDLHIYRFKVYNSSLTDRGILNNFIADARSAEEMIARYNHNQIYDENQMLTPEVLAEKCPWLRVYKVSAPYFTNNKSDKVPGTTIQQIYKNGDPVLDNWTCYNSQHSGQGTSSNNYGGAGRNLDFIMNISGVDGIKPYFILGDGSKASTITLSRTSVPTAYLNAKVNIASSNNMTNAMLANRYNRFQPYRRPFVRDEGVDTSFIKDTMEFYNCVIFIQETNEDLSTHREFADTSYHFYAIGNIGDSKKTDKSRLTDQNDKYECCMEVMDVELPISDFPIDTMVNAMGYTIDEKTSERVYTWATNDNLGILYEKVNGQYVLTQDVEVNLDKTYYVDILENEDFSEDYTYGWRYIDESGTNEENKETFDFCKQKWIDFYRFVTTSTDDEFKEHFGDYAVLDTFLYYYLFTTRYCLVDNRAKNLFFHYGKTTEVDTDSNPVRKWDLTWAYDLDTALGINNYGKQAYRYGLEDIDVDENGEEVFRESDSTLFCRIRDLFQDELKSMYNTLESKGAWHAESFINEADEWQSQFPEELWRVDIYRKYGRTYNNTFINGKGDAQFLVNMSNGKMKYHRRQWERSQEKYMASKYQSSVASSDNSVFRCSVPSGDLVVEPNYRLKLTPYAYMYLNVKYGTQAPIQLRAMPNVTYEIPFDGNKADIVDIYSSSLIQDFGDLSTCYIATADTTKAVKVKKLIFGNSTPGYDNPNFTTLTTGANHLLEILNIENVSGLKQSLNLSVLNNLRELYAHGSNISGVTFANAGKIEIAKLPAINAMNMRNLIYLTNLDITSFDNLTTLTIENCSTVDVKSILDAAQNVNRIRITGIDWSLSDTSLLDRIYNMSGLDKDGYNTERAILSGKVHVPVMRQKKLADYRAAWSDLEIAYDTLVTQYAVTFKNDDGTILDVQYVDKGGSAVDPITREENPISIPTKESTIENDFTFLEWDSSLADIFSDRIITATYTSSLREYSAKYVSKGTVLYEKTGKYGEIIDYVGDIPTYTDEESAYVFYLFDRWDKSGLIDGEKVINAIFDRFEYTSGYFNNKELSDMKPVEIYAMNKLGLETSVLSDKDSLIFTVGRDYNYDDIESQTIISAKTMFSGGNYLDTGIKLFEEDRDFVLAVDYNFLEGCVLNSTLMQCFQSNGSNGMKLWYNNGVRFTWGTSSKDISGYNNREIIVIRHRKGENNLLVYNSDMANGSPAIIELPRNKTTLADSTLVFGCEKADDGAYENYAVGNIYWAKLWYMDLGENVCSKLSLWIHEELPLEVSGFKKYYLTDNPSKRCSFSLLASRLLDRDRPLSSASTNEGGWAAMKLNKLLNDRFYNAIPDQWRQLIKQVTILSSTGNKSTEVSGSQCYISIPACIEVDPTMTSEPYIYEDKPISYMTTNEMRKRSKEDGEYYPYWLRSPNSSYTNYMNQVDNEGNVRGYYYPYSSSGVLVELSM